MQYLAAYALAALSGKKEVAEADITKILQATGQPVNDAEVKKVVSTLKGKKLEDLIKNGLGKVGSVGASAPAAKAADKAPAKEEKKEVKKETKKEEPKVEAPPEDDFGGAGDLFGDM